MASHVASTVKKQNDESLCAAVASPLYIVQDTTPERTVLPAFSVGTVFLTFQFKASVTGNDLLKY